MFVTLSVFAQGTEYKLLEPIPYVESKPGSSTVQSYIPGVIQLIVGVAGALAVIMIIVGGIQYMSTDAIGKKDQAKHTIQNAVWGFILVLSSWLILATVNPDLTSLNLTLEAPRAGSDLTSAETGEAGSTGNPWPDDLAIRTELASGGIGVAVPKCTWIGQTNCTSVTGLSPKVASGLKALKQQCGGCEVFITGGTEYWSHLSHNKGVPVVDLRSHTQTTPRTENSLTKYIKEKGTRETSSECANGERYKLPSGGTYVLESASAKNTGIHWHVCY